MVHTGNNNEGTGWLSRFRVVVFDRSPCPVYGQHIFVSQASCPQRACVSLDGYRYKPGTDWAPKLDFWVYSHDVGDCVMIAVGEQTTPCYRCKLEIGRRIGNAPEDVGWQEKFVFWIKSGSFV